MEADVHRRRDAGRRGEAGNIFRANMQVADQGWRGR
jgi:hypothetical protein